MKLDPQTLYTLIGRLIEATPPDLGVYEKGGEMHVLEWLGKAEAYVKATGDLSLLMALQMELKRIHTGEAPWAAREIRGLLFRALALNELAAPPAVAGAFIPVDSGFDAFAAITKVLKRAKFDILIVDPYMNETVLTEFGTTIPERIGIRLLTTKIPQNAAVEPAARNWLKQFDTRPLELRWAPKRSLHDRVLLIDKAEAWTLTQSLKDFAARSPGEIIRTDHSANMKVDAYEEIWADAEPMSPDSGAA